MLATSTTSCRPLNRILALKLLQPDFGNERKQEPAFVARANMTGSLIDGRMHLAACEVAGVVI
jgi:hypothetical protein